MSRILSAEYRESAAPRSLADRLVCLWTQIISDGKGDYRHPVLPDGCVDIIWIGDSEPIVAGPANRRVVVNLPAATILVGARFRPGWAASSLGLPANELLNQEVVLSQLWTKPDIEKFEQVRACESAAAKLHAVKKVLANHYRDGSLPDPLIRDGIDWLVRRPQRRIHDLAKSIGLSDRQLQRRFQLAVGFGPKMFHRILRMQRCLDLLRDPANTRSELAGLAYDAGYSDQPHMCREIRDLTGSSPQALIEKSNAFSTMSEIFNTACETPTNNGIR